MNRFKVIFAMQLKEKLDLSYLHSKKQTLFKVVFGIIGFIIVTMVAYFVLYLCQTLNLFSAINHVPLSFMAFVFFVMFVLNTFTTTLGLSKTLYYAKDNLTLITYPVSPNTLFLSKMLVYYISEIKKTVTLQIPIFLAYGILSNFGFMYYIWCPIMLVLFTAVPVLIGGLLSIPTNYILLLLNRHPILKVILVAILLGGVLWGATYVISLIPSNINLIKSWTTVSMTIRNFLSFFTTYFNWFYVLLIFLCGNYVNFHQVLFTHYSYIVLLIILAIIAVLIGLNLITSRPFYLRLMTKQFEYKKKIVKAPKQNRANSGKFSGCMYETIRYLRHEGVMSVTLSLLIISPIAVFLLNKIYSAISTRILGDYFTISFNVLMILLLALSSSIMVSSAYSKDGDALVINKTRPITSSQFVLPRLIYNFISSTIILVISGGIFLSFSNIGVGNSILLMLSMFCVLCTHIVWSAEIDFVSPKQNLFAESGSATKNPNETKSIILCFALSAIFFGLTLFLLIDAMKFVYLKLFAITLAVLLLRVYLFYYKSKVLYREMGV